MGANEAVSSGAVNNSPFKIRERNMLGFCVVCALVLGAVVAVTGASRAAEVDKAVRFLALGDSYTIGESVPETGRWPVQLAATLRASAVNVAQPLIIARTGWTTDELHAAMTEAHLEAGWDLVSLLIGVNNQYRGRSVDEYREEFTGLLEWAIELAGGDPGRVFVVSIPDWGVTRFAAEHDRDPETVAEEIDAYNAAAAEIANAYSVAWIDITDISRAHPEMVAPDGLHPSGAQYSAWVERVAPVVRDLLGQQ